MCPHYKAPGAGNHSYPPDEALVELMRELRTYPKVAAVCGVRRESLRDYLKIRPELKARMDVHSIRLERAARTPEQRVAIHREQRRLWAAKQRREDPERKRQLNREWAKRQPPENRAKWNNYNRLRRKASGADQKPVDVPSHIYSDPCSYCGGSGGTVDHIEAIHHGGTNDPDNYTAACLSCNAAKGARFTLLGFLLHRLS